VPPGAATAPAPVLPQGPQPEVIATPAPAAPAEPPVSAAERSLLLDLRKRRAELEEREAALASREGILAATEKRLADRAGELADLQKRLEALEGARRERDEENWKGLVKLYETMKPRDAAAIFNDLDRPVLLAVLDRMKEAKAAPVLAAMQPERARQITADLAQRRTQANRPADPAPPRAPGG
jgi:flagellar motility protein MotE (MotC chaperone)